MSETQSDVFSPLNGSFYHNTVTISEENKNDN